MNKVFPVLINQKIYSGSKTPHRASSFRKTKKERLYFKVCRTENLSKIKGAPETRRQRGQKLNILKHKTYTTNSKYKGYINFKQGDLTDKK